MFPNPLHPSAHSTLPLADVLLSFNRPITFSEPPNFSFFTSYDGCCNAIVVITDVMNVNMTISVVVNCIVVTMAACTEYIVQQITMYSRCYDKVINL